ncbi:MAG: RNA-guided pseudouridylation complex pseudouridine synthase subunit Cbf5, partial [Candidatus Aenigmarchaeota archaeon]|nr:RNA-guided pseudouridylation complex pseudouridine synthase subunit Cbf5 [Candidatus Aenigmarchaeota archaeon]
MTFIVRSAEIAKYGQYPGSRSVEELLSKGLIILDKWQGPTSHDVSSMVKKILVRSKSGHSGTLDPMVSGVLIVALDNACKVLPALQRQDKEYVGVMHLHKAVDDRALGLAIKKITGEITQRPPVR